METPTTINLKYYFMSTAEVVDAFRGIPRLLVAGYCYLVWDTVNWFMLLPEPTTNHTVLISTIIGGAAAVFGLYVNSGSGWDRKTARKDVYIQHTTPPKVKRPHKHTHVYDDFNEDGTVPSAAFVFETPPRGFMED